MKVLMLVNWNVRYVEHPVQDLQTPDYVAENEKYWFFKYWPKDTEVDVVGVGNSWFTKNIEKKILRLYLLQSLKVLFKLKKYDVIISHGAQSGVFLSLLRRVLRIKKPKHIVIDIGSFNSAKESGMILKCIQPMTKSIDGLIYHTSKQIEYYKGFYPWLVDKSKFMTFGTNIDFFEKYFKEDIKEEDFILTIGYADRDWETLFKAFEKVDDNKTKLKVIGKNDFSTTRKNVITVPPMNISEISEQIQKSLFVVMPLEYVNYSYGQMTILHAMLLQKAIIVADVPSMVDYVHDGKTAMLYKNGNVDDLSCKMSLLLSDSELRHNIGVNARKSVINEYNEKIMSENIYNFVKSTLKK